MYGLTWSFGLWCLKVRATGNVYYGKKLSEVLEFVGQPLC